MSFRLYLKYYLVHQLGFTNKEAIKALLSRELVINGQIITENIEFDEHCEIYYRNQLLKPRTAFTYISCYKPRGIETTFNPEIPNNLGTIFKFNKHLGYIGRLDKDSEGLLLLTNDGKYIQKLSNPLFEKEKEYVVTVDKVITDEFIEKMSRGIDIRISITKPCIVEKLSDLEFKIVLTEGKNRQIRRMCKVLGYYVQRLIRTRIDEIHIGNLQSGEFKIFNPIR